MSRESALDQAQHYFLTETMEVVHRQTVVQNAESPNAKKKDSQLMTAAFTAICLAIFGTIAFSIWLSVEVGINQKNVWFSGELR